MEAGEPEAGGVGVMTEAKVGVTSRKPEQTVQLALERRRKGPGAKDTGTSKLQKAKKQSLPQSFRKEHSPVDPLIRVL